MAHIGNIRCGRGLYQVQDQNVILLSDEVLDLVGLLSLIALTILNNNILRCESKILGQVTNSSSL